MNKPHKTTHPIPDKAQIAVDFPDKFYMGSFARESKFEARAENDGLFIKLTRSGEQKRAVEIHLHHYLLSDILSAWADSLIETPQMEAEHKIEMLDALKQVERAVRKTKPPKRKLKST
jgi:hypothetical protein